MNRPGNPDSNDKPPLPRRTFLASAAALTAGFTIVPRHVLGGQGPDKPAPSDKLNIAAVGVGGMGEDQRRPVRDGEHRRAVRRRLDVRRPDLHEVPEREDVPGLPRDARRAEGHRRGHRRHARPHHAVIAMAAMQRGKHVYVQKPLTHSVAEARLLTEAARKYKVVDPDGQPGALGRGHPPDLCEWVGTARIGEVREVHAWTNRPVWPSGRRGGPAEGDAARAGGRSTGTSGSAPRRRARTIRRTTRGSGVRGGTSAPARSATWAATSSTRSSGP